MKYLLDTCVVSELVRRVPDDHVCAWVDARDEDALYLSVLTLGEVRKGIVKLADRTRRAALQAWLDRDLRDRFSGRILPVSVDVALVWGGLCGEAEGRGQPVPSIDGLIGATAIAHGLIVATRNVSDIGSTGARVHNPWKS